MSTKPNQDLAGNYDIHSTAMKEIMKPERFTGINQELFDHMANCHNLILVQSEMEHIIDICNKAPYKKEDNDTRENVWVLKKDAEAH